MNRENVQTLLYHLKQIPPQAFHMRSFAENHECGTVACLAGHAAVLSGEVSAVPSGPRPEDMMFITSEGLPRSPGHVATDWLGLTVYESIHMFTGSWSPKGTGEFSVEKAIEYLEEVLRHNNVLLRINQGVVRI